VNNLINKGCVHPLDAEARTMLPFFLKRGRISRTSGVPLFEDLALGRI
jgi:hypothetical protein